VERQQTPEPRTTDTGYWSHRYWSHGRQTILETPVSVVSLLQWWLSVVACGSSSISCRSHVVSSSISCRSWLQWLSLMAPVSIAPGSSGGCRICRLWLPSGSSMICCLWLQYLLSCPVAPASSICRSLVAPVSPVVRVSSGIVCRLWLHWLLFAALVAPAVSTVSVVRGSSIVHLVLWLQYCPSCSVAPVW